MFNVPTTGKLLYDSVNARLAAQKDNQSALVSRAKDLLGLTSLVGTITSVLANDKLFNIGKVSPAAWWFWVTGITLVIAIGAALLALRPRSWSFATDPEDLAQAMQDPAYATSEDDDWYEAIATGFMTPEPRRTGWLPLKHESLTQLQYNAGEIDRLGRLVLAQAFSLAALVTLTFLLIPNTHRGS